jgi:hypothetical protein
MSRGALVVAVALGLAAVASAQPSLLGVSSQAPASGLVSGQPVNHTEEEDGFRLVMTSKGGGAFVRLEAPADRAADVQHVMYVRGVTRVAQGTGYTQLDPKTFPHVYGSGDGWRAELSGQTGDPIEARVQLRRTPYAIESWPILSWFSPGTTETVVVRATIPGERLAPVIRGLDLVFRYRPLENRSGRPTRDPSYQRVTAGSFGFEARLTGDAAMLARVRAIDVKHRDHNGSWRRIARLTDLSAPITGEFHGASWVAYLMVREGGILRSSASHDPRDPGQAQMRLDIELEGMSPVKDFGVVVPAPAGVP